MPLRLRTADPAFEAAFAALVDGKREAAVDVSRDVRTIIGEVVARGDEALIELTRRFDGVALSAATLRVGAAEIDHALRTIDPSVRDALERAASRITAFHERQRPPDLAWTDGEGVGLGLRWRPVDSVGLYVPGGTAAYPSSVLMNALPARIAGVPRLVMVVPAQGGVLDPQVLAAAAIAGVDEIYRIGGAQAVAALAYGTRTVPSVDKIVGPGNAWVAEAKRQVFGRVGIDMIAGPSEILIVADGAQDPAWIAADLLSQAEHDEVAQAILITDDDRLAGRVARALEAQLADLPRRAVAAASWRDHGAIIVVGDLAREAPALVDRIAPEHLELMVGEPERLAAAIRHAGSIFLGACTPEVIGDYTGGPNHVLPTGRTARFASGLSVFDFLKRTTLLRCDRAAFERLAPTAERLARAEGLEAHARAIRIRLHASAGG
ncbi:MAG TPA: histidinol dehydrogenase [Geminicoccaceae bacterium]